MVCLHKQTYVAPKYCTHDLNPLRSFPEHREIVQQKARVKISNNKYHQQFNDSVCNIFLLNVVAELGAGLGGGSGGRSHLQRDTEEGSDSAGGQQGSEMARGEWA